MPTAIPIHKSGRMAKQHEPPRLSPTKRGYGYHWQRVRKMYLRHNPLCADCKTHGETVRAVEVHHIDNAAQGEARYAEANLMALCKRCHGKRTREGA
ncbi:hypothetical protein LCGC14_3032380, partial [marine sediment metagenome]